MSLETVSLILYSGVNFVEEHWKSRFQLLKNNKKKLGSYRSSSPQKYFVDETSQLCLEKQSRTNHTIPCVTVHICTARLFQVGIAWSALQCVLLPRFKLAVNFPSSVVLPQHSQLLGLPLWGRRAEPRAPRDALCIPLSAAAALGCWCRAGSREGRASRGRRSYPELEQLLVQPPEGIGINRNYPKR